MYESADEAPDTPLDRKLLPRLDALHLKMAPNCSDGVFIRRAYLDVTGSLPPTEIAAAFIKSKQRDKRSKLIDSLLASDAYAVYWSMKWGDLLRVKSEFPINLWPNAAQAYHEWIYQSLLDNKPYDIFARELLTSSGSNFRQPAVNFYRALQGKDPASLAQAAALTFLGTRLENWSAVERANLELFFSRVAFKPTAEWKEEIIYLDPSSYSQLKLTTPDGRTLQMPRNGDPREFFANWLIAPDNQWFARTLVNRQWAWLMGRGIIHEPDDIRPNNLPTHPELLHYLEQQLIQSDYDMKHIFRLILNSRCYQQSSRPVIDGSLPAENFAVYPVRRMEAEVLSDVLNQLTGTSETYISMIPEPFTFIPQDSLTIALPDGSISSSFLQLFGRPERDTGYFSERDSRTNAKQSLHLLNSSHISKKIQHSKWTRGLAAGPFTHERLRPVYMAFYSREPTEAEVSALQTYDSDNFRKRLESAQDLVWALVNSKEFLYQH
ncbi:DUF1553 domain-containing protein [Coraliomargarita sp. W4R72]